MLGINVMVSKQVAWKKKKGGVQGWMSGVLFIFHLGWIIGSG